ncbi:hypothetical protein D7S86_00115 [Pararobbsia silviterrae]|uniref:Uncharacterized protein n=1 Tax=Pararobbsia silviterrae TaxID=1792498 RepID=A0A494Y6S4_9BURK|nr:hypothetical protein D7S86_00115 [Pararobbsia silviterrae]
MRRLRDRAHVRDDGVRRRLARGCPARVDSSVDGRVSRIARRPHGPRIARAMRGMIAWFRLAARVRAQCEALHVFEPDGDAAERGDAARDRPARSTRWR